VDRQSILRSPLLDFEISHSSVFKFPQTAALSREAWFHRMESGWRTPRIAQVSPRYESQNFLPEKTPSRSPWAADSSLNGAVTPVELFTLENAVGFFDPTTTPYSVTGDGQRFLVRVLANTPRPPIHIAVNWPLLLKR
jgi:hypothetical protein